MAMHCIGASKAPILWYASSVVYNFCHSQPPVHGMATYLDNDCEAPTAEVIHDMMLLVKSLPRYGIEVLRRSVNAGSGGGRRCDGWRGDEAT